MAIRPSWLSCFSVPPVHNEAALNPGRTILPLRRREVAPGGNATRDEPESVEPKYIRPRSFRHRGRDNKQ